MIRSIVLIGAGNLATQLGFSLAIKGFNIRQVYSYNIKNAEALANRVNAYATDNLKEVQTDADLYIVAVKDAVLSLVIEDMPVVKGIVTHTAGSLSIDMLSKFSSYGIFYPFQTFSKEREVNFEEIPLLIESNEEAVQARLEKFGSKISKTVIHCDSNQRKQIHLAAVFACNFSNHMYAIADSILQKSNVSFNAIMPLIKETAHKVEEMSPLKAQTGPAIRGDENTIEEHLKLLAGDEDLAFLYKRLTKGIQNN